MVMSMGKPKLTEEMVDQAIKLKADGLSNGDIICALGVHESTFYRWIGDPKNKLQRELSEGLKKEEAEFKHTLLTTIRSAALSRSQYWTAAAWLLERKYPDEYGKADRRGDEVAAGDVVPKIVLGVAVKPVQEVLELDTCEEETSAGINGEAGSPSHLLEGKTDAASTYEQGQRAYQLPDAKEDAACN